MSDYLPYLAVVVMALVTIAIRFLPFIIFSGNTKTPAVVSYLGKVLPYAIMGMLVVYCLKETAFSSLKGFMPQLIAGGLVVGSYIWKRNTLISILLGTVVYMLLVQMVFV